MKGWERKKAWVTNKKGIGLWTHATERDPGQEVLEKAAGAGTGSGQGDEYERINKPQQFPPPSLVPRGPSLFSSPPHRALAKLPFLPYHIAHCLQQTLWHLTEFHLNPQKGKGSGGHRGRPPTQARIFIQDPCMCLAHNLQAFPFHESYLPNWATSFQREGRAQCHSFVCLESGPQEASTVLTIARTQCVSCIIACPKASLIFKSCFLCVYLAQQEFRGVASETQVGQYFLMS